MTFSDQVLTSDTAIKAGTSTITSTGFMSKQMKITLNMGNKQTNKQTNKYK